MNAERDLELILLGAVLASTALATAAFADVTETDLGESDIRPVYEELRKEKKLGNATRDWLKRRGVTVDGKAIAAVIDSVAARARKRRLACTVKRLDLALAGGCEEEVAACLAELGQSASLEVQSGAANVNGKPTEKVTT